MLIFRQFLFINIIYQLFNYDYCIRVLITGGYDHKVCLSEPPHGLLPYSKIKNFCPDQPNNSKSNLYYLNIPYYGNYNLKHEIKTHKYPILSFKNNIKLIHFDYVKLRLIYAVFINDELRVKIENSDIIAYPSFFSDNKYIEFVNVSFVGNISSCKILYKGSESVNVTIYLKYSRNKNIEPFKIKTYHFISNSNNKRTDIIHETSNKTTDVIHETSNKTTDVIHETSNKTTDVIHELNRYKTSTIVFVILFVIALIVIFKLKNGTYQSISQNSTEIELTELRDSEEINRDVEPGNIEEITVVVPNNRVEPDSTEEITVVVPNNRVEPDSTEEITVDLITESLPVPNNGREIEHVESGVITVDQVSVLISESLPVPNNRVEPDSTGEIYVDLLAESLPVPNNCREIEPVESGVITVNHSTVLISESLPVPNDRVEPDGTGEINVDLLAESLPVPNISKEGEPDGTREINVEHSSNLHTQSPSIPYIDSTIKLIDSEVINFEEFIYSESPFIPINISNDSIDS